MLCLIGAGLFLNVCWLVWECCTIHKQNQPLKTESTFTHVSVYQMDDNKNVNE